MNLNVFANEVGYLATLSPELEPSIRSILFTYSTDDSVGFVTQQNTQKFSDIKSNNSCLICFKTYESTIVKLNCSTTLLPNKVTNNIWDNMVLDGKLVDIYKDLDYSPICSHNELVTKILNLKQTLAQKELSMPPIIVGINCLATKQCTHSLLPFNERIAEDFISLSFVFHQADNDFQIKSNVLPSLQSDLDHMKNINGNFHGDCFLAATDTREKLMLITIYLHEIQDNEIIFKLPIHNAKNLSKFEVLIHWAEAHKQLRIKGELSQDNESSNNIAIINSIDTLKIKDNSRLHERIVYHYKDSVWNTSQAIP